MTVTRYMTVAALMLSTAPVFADADMLTYGVRPAFLIDKMEDGPLKEKLASCLGQAPERSLFSIGHRGAPMQFPEHTAQSNLAAARMGAGILECDVTFTKDKELVCRHAQNDLHTTTNIVATDLGAKCTTPFAPAAGGENAKAECRTSDLTLAEFKTLKPKMDAANKAATTAQDYLGGTADWRTDLYVDGTNTLTHAESIELFKSLGAKFTPELKSPSVDMPFDGFSQADYAQKLIDEYKAAGVPASDVWAQSFNIEDVKYWIENEPEFGAQAVYLDDQYNNEGFDAQNPETWEYSMQELADMGIKFVAPPMWMLVTLDDAGNMVPSEYAKQATAAGLNLITWTLERSGPLANGGGWYFQSVKDATDNDADYFNILHVLAQDVGVKGVFSDWPATVTYYANCFDM